MIAIGVGNATDFGELTDIASENPDTNKTMVYQVGSVQALQTLDRVVAHVACKGTCLQGCRGISFFYLF